MHTFQSDTFAAMVTRGYFVFKINGIYYAFYNHCDSYPRGGMGQSLVQQIKDVILRHNGNSKAAAAYWISIFAENNRFPGAHKEGIKGYDDLENKFKNRLTDFAMESSTRPPRMDLFIEYVYIIDLENCMLWFTDRNFGDAPGAERAWPKISWNTIRRIDSTEIAMYMRSVFRDEYKDEDENPLNTIPRTLLALTLQPLVRGFLERRRQCAPPHGYFYLLSKKQFEAAQHVSALSGDKA